MPDRFRKLLLYLSLLLLGGVFLGPLVTYATLTLDSTSITTDDTLKLKGGNVGVGNITPTSNLHVSGTLNVTATSTAAALSVSGASALTGALTLSNPSTNSLIYTNSTGVVTALASSTAGKILTASGTAPYFSWETTGSLANLTLTGPSTNSVIYTGSAGLITALASSTAGKVLMATSTAPYFSWETDATGGTVSTLVADANNEITVGSTTSALTVNIANAPLSAAQTINIGSGSTGATSTSINIGGGTGANTVNIATGATNAKTISIGTGAVQNTISIGHASATVSIGGNITLASSTDALTLNLGANTGRHTVNIATGNASTTVSIGSGSTTASINSANWKISTQGTSTSLTGSTLTYNEFTASINVTATSEATAQSVVTSTAYTFDGATSVIIEFGCARLQPPAAVANLWLVLFDGSSGIGKQAIYTGGLAQTFYFPCTFTRRLTPSAGSHTYSIRAWVDSGSGGVTADVGGANTNMPGFIRIVKDN